MVDRKSSKSRWGVYERSNKVINKGLSICIFPEQDYVDESILLNHFKRGAFKIAIRNQLTILPLVFYDCKRKFPWYASYGYPGSLRVKALPKIESATLKEEDLEELTKGTYHKIKKVLLEDEKKTALQAIDLWHKIRSSA